MNILFLSNIATPYQLDFLKKIDCSENANIYGYFLYSKEKNRDWSLNLPNYVNVANFSYKISDYYNLYVFIKEKKISHILIGGYSIPTIFWVILLSKILNIKLYNWSERPVNYYFGIKQKLKDIYIKTIFYNSSKIFAIGHLAVNAFSIYSNKIVNLPYSMNLEKFYNIKREASSCKKINFLFSGQYIDRKNIINTIEAFKSIKNSEIRLNIIGGGELKDEVHSLIKNDTRINELGFVQPSELSQIYSENEIFLMPSKHDGWALVINEAMAAGMPIISTNKVGAVSEYIIHEKNGFVCDVSKDSIKEGIEYYIKNFDLINIHGNENRKKMKSSLGDVENASRLLIKEFLND